ncbi:MAG: hypothetical protein J1E95_07885 [Muribaculaceae bacterium]|nr:hypothetical protein [Muribaculaceae bacterium]
MRRKLNISRILGFSNLCIFMLSLSIFISCREEDSFVKIEEGKVEFLARLKSIDQLKTRFDSTYINRENFNLNFYIEMFTQNESNFGIYGIPSGYEGRLDCIDNNEPLMWKSLNIDHTFYSWTIPWDEDYYKDGITTEPVIIEFHNSSNTEGFEEFKNNQIYETFIGAKSESYNYKNHGKYVDLTFFHLVSRIEIGTFQLTEPSGAIQRDLKADVTFLNMPTTATFYPHPALDQTGNQRRPYVLPDAPDPNKGITYFIDNSATETDLFYICPEVDFSQIEFQIKIKSEKYKDRETYYGSFADIKFVRTGVDHDLVDGNDDKVLHAGEEMKININLIPGIGPGLAVIIDEWSTQKPNEAEYHPYPGLYSETELNELRSLFMQLASEDDEEILDKIRNLYILYGSPGEKGEKYLNLYSDMELKGNDANIFPVWKEYILNGLGHTVTMKTNSGNYWGTGNKPYFNIGPCRNIYFTDGNFTVYIDADGYVWVTDPTTGNLKITENKLEDLNTYENGKYNSYDINAETGQIRYSTYFNGKITG